MRTIQRRWLCAACRREWVFVHASFNPFTGQVEPWDSTHCPTCWSEQIDRVEYLPVCPGADLTPGEWLSMPSMDLPPVPERRELQRDRNEALMRLDPYAEQMASLLGVQI